MILSVFLYRWYGDCDMEQWYGGPILSGTLEKKGQYLCPGTDMGYNSRGFIMSDEVNRMGPVRQMFTPFNNRKFLLMFLTTVSASLGDMLLLSVPRPTSCSGWLGEPWRTSLTGEGC
jgi:hypothetical protein